MSEKEIKKSVLPKELFGVVFVTGQRGLGKTIFGVQTDLPENICFLDFESKGAYWNELLNFGLYVDVPSAVAQEMKGKDFGGREIWKYTKKLIDDLPPNKFTTLVIDTVGDFESYLGEEIRFAPNLYGVKANQVGGGFGGIYPALGAQIESILSRLHAKGVRVVVAIAHTKSAWAAGGPVPNKLRSHGNSIWHDRSMLELVLLPSGTDTPAALVQKESLAGVKLNRETGTFEFKRRLPLRLPRCTWGEIRNYLDNPADLSDPKEGELPTEEERAPYSEFFNREQMELLIRAQERLAEEPS